MINSRFFIHLFLFGELPRLLLQKYPNKKAHWNHPNIQKVEWFVSHWWGTSVATYCSALRRHAYEVKVGFTVPPIRVGLERLHPALGTFDISPFKGHLFQDEFPFPTRDDMLVCRRVKHKGGIESLTRKFCTHFSFEILRSDVDM